MISPTGKYEILLRLTEIEQRIKLIEEQPKLARDTRGRVAERDELFSLRKERETLTKRFQSE